MSIGVYRVTLTKMLHKHLEYLNRYIKAIASLKNAESDYGQELQALASLELDTIQAIRNSLAEHQLLFTDTKKPEESKVRYTKLLAQIDEVLTEFTDLPCRRLTLHIDAKKSISPKMFARLPQDAEFIGITGIGISAVFRSKKSNSGMICSFQTGQMATTTKNGEGDG